MLGGEFFSHRCDIVQKDLSNIDFPLCTTGPRVFGVGEPQAQMRQVPGFWLASDFNL